jgi:hypothetical protein
MGTEKVAVIVVVGEPPAEDVRVTRGEEVIAIVGVEAVDVRDGVRIACSVRAAAVCTSLGGGNCSKGQLQARIDRIRLNPARIDLKFRVINICSFRLAAWGTFLLIVSFQASGLYRKIGIQTENPATDFVRGVCLADRVLVIDQMVGMSINYFGSLA